MQAREVKTVEDAKAIVQERELTHVKVGLFDNDGVTRVSSSCRSRAIARKVLAR